MAYIEPNTNVIIYKEVPLDNTYEHTLWYDKPQDQYDDFISPTGRMAQGNRIIARLDKQYFQRTSRGYMRVKMKYADLYNANYMAFQNASFGSKWFFAFITSVEYINNEVTELSFELDVMQTYLFDVEVLNCFVERQHSATDLIGQNLVEEDISIGDEYAIAEKTEIDLTPNKICFLMSKLSKYGSTDVGNPSPSNVNNIINSVGIITSENTYSAFKTALDNIQDVILADNVIEAYQYPSTLDTLIPDNATKVKSDSTSGGYDKATKAKSAYTPDLTIPSAFGNFRNIQNNKLYTYPYSKIVVSNNSGSNEEYRWEFFDYADGGNMRRFAYSGTLLPMPQFKIYPVSYRGLSYDYENSVNMKDFPTVPVNTDSFKAYIATNKAQLSTSLLTSVLSNSLTAFNVGTSGVAGRYPAMGSLGSIAGTVAKTVDAKAVPNSVVGNANHDGLKAGLSRYCFTIYKMQIHEEWARIVDSYFTMFGYAEKKIAHVNRNVRPIFTYTKTLGCSLRSGWWGDSPNSTKLNNIKYGAPVDAVSTIKGIYDKGITFWKNVNNVGIYNLNNKPV